MLQGAFYNTRQGIEYFLRDLDSLHQLVHIRKTAADLGEILNSWIILKQWRLDEKGGIDQVTFKVSPEELIQFSLIIRENELRLKYSNALQFSAKTPAPAHITCHACKEYWRLNNAFDYTKSIQKAKIPLRQYTNYNFEDLEAALRRRKEAEFSLIRPTQSDHQGLVLADEVYDFKITLYFHKQCYTDWYTNHSYHIISKLLKQANYQINHFRVAYAKRIFGIISDIGFEFDTDCGRINVRRVNETFAFDSKDIQFENTNLIEQEEILKLLLKAHQNRLK